MILSLFESSLYILTIVGQLFFLLIFVFWILGIKNHLEKIRKNSHILLFIVSFLSVLGSLYFSEIKGFEPCKLCWIQRIFMYPQFFLFSLEMIFNRFVNKLAIYNHLVLSGIGALFSFYHYGIQIGLIPTSSSCEIIGYSKGCAQIFTMAYGYITIPLMALTAFSLIILISFLKTGYKPQK